MSARAAACRGFTMVEISIAVLIIGLLLTGLMLPLQTQVDQRKVDETRFALEQAREALLVYAAEFGYLPCPANETSNGQEAPGFNHATGACATYYGFLPARTIGYTPVDAQGYAVDAWGSPSNRIRYAVSNETIAGVAAPFTRTRGLATAGAPAVAAATNLLYVCGSGSGVVSGVSCGTSQTLASNAAVVLWSVGPNGAGGAMSVHEAENPHPKGGSADRIFVSRERSGGAGTEFDDVVLWLPSLYVVNRLIAAGQLP